MKVRRLYTMTILDWRGLIVISRPKHPWVSFMQANATGGCRIFDCTFNQLMENLRMYRGSPIEFRK